MLSDNDLQELIGLLNGEVDDVKKAFLYLDEKPIGDKRNLPHLEALLDDRRPCILSVPIRYGELRWLVAEALMAEREKLGINEPVKLPNVVNPATSWELEQLCKEAGVDTKLKSPDKLKELIRLGKAPVQHRVFFPHPKET